MCALTKADLSDMTVASLTKRLVESNDINAQQIKDVLKTRHNVLSKNTTKELVAHEYARTVCGAVKLLVQGGVVSLRADPPEEIGGVGGGRCAAGVTGGGEVKVVEDREVVVDEDKCEEGEGAGKRTPMPAPPARMVLHWDATPGPPLSRPAPPPPPIRGETANTTATPATPAHQRQVALQNLQHLHLQQLALQNMQRLQQVVLHNVTAAKRAQNVTQTPATRAARIASTSTQKSRIAVAGTVAALD